MSIKTRKRSGQFHLKPRRVGPFKFWLWWVTVKT